MKKVLTSLIAFALAAAGFLPAHAQVGSMFEVSATIFDEGPPVPPEPPPISRPSSSYVPDREPPANPLWFTGIAREDGIHLSWQNPRDPDFDAVRIMRIEGGIPAHPFDGTPIYEGRLEYFLDRDVVPGVFYGYALFARDRSGNWSSGAVIYLRAYFEEGIDDSGILEPDDVADPADSPLFPGLIVAQAGRFVPPVDGAFTLRADLPFGIALSAGVVPQTLKTIIVTLQDPDDAQKTFSFLLRRNHEGTYYVAKLGALEREGAYRAVLSVMDFNAQSIESVGFMLYAVFPESALASPPWHFLLLTAYGLLFFFWLFFLLWLLIALIRRSEEEEAATA